MNAIVNATFERDASVATAAKNDYNRDSDREGWKAKYTRSIASSLSIYDGFDTLCGNQAFASDAGDVGRYTNLAGVLADDRQWLDTAGTAPGRYLAVELASLRGAVNTEQGGRTLTMDVVDETYNLVGNTLTQNALTDGVARKGAKTDGAAFPFLAAPQR